MRRILTIAGALVLAAGCASSTHEQREAQTHDQRAQEAAASGDYDRMQREQQKAARERREAEQRGGMEEQGTPAPAEPMAPSTPTNPYTP
jgi:hypothetical protein